MWFHGKGIIPCMNYLPLQSTAIFASPAGMVKSLGSTDRDILDALFALKVEPAVCFDDTPFFTADVVVAVADFLLVHGRKNNLSRNPKLMELARQLAAEREQKAEAANVSGRN